MLGMENKGIDGTIVNGSSRKRRRKIDSRSEGRSLELSDKKVEKPKKRSLDPSFLIFRNIPPRVVVYKILPNHIVTLTSENHMAVRNIGETVANAVLELFGYFERDLSRSIFLLFLSIEVYSFKKVFFDRFFQDMFTLDISLLDQKLVDHVILKSKRFLKLRTLKIEGGKKADFLHLFSKENCYPSLKKLELSQISRCHSFHPGKEGSTIDLWNKAEHLWSNLKEFRISCEEGVLFDPKLFRMMKNLEKVVLSHVSFHGSPQRFEFPKLKVLQLDETYDFFVDRCPKLTTLSYFSAGDSPKFHNLEEIFKRPTTRIENLVLCHHGYHDEYVEEEVDRWWIFRAFFGDQNKYLKTLYLGIKCGGDFEEDDCLGENLNTLDVRSGAVGTHIFSNSKTHYLHLEDLSIVYAPEFTGKFSRSPLCGRLKILRFDEVEHLDDEFFKENKFTRLESLELLFCPNLDGEGWNPFPMLKEFHISFDNNRIGTYDEEVQFNPFFFQRGMFKKLEVLVIEEMMDLVDDAATNWDDGVTKSLKKLQIGHCNYLGDELLSSNEFPNLEVLKVGDNRKMKGYKWKEMKKLRSLKLRKCKAMTDKLFQSVRNVTNFPCLENLELDSCKNLKDMETWKFLPSLRCIVIKDVYGTDIDPEFVDPERIKPYVDFVEEHFYL